MSPRPAARRALAAVLGLLLVAAACGADDAEPTAGDAPTDTAGAAATEADGAGATTITHAFGTTTLDEVPERIVSLGTQWTDVLLALDVQPVGHLSDPLAGETGTYPWQDDLSADSRPIEATDGLPLEQIAALEPDLILVTYLAPDQESFDALAAIAPTIGLLGDRQVDRWQDLIATAGDVLARSDEAASVTAEVEGLVADTAAELPGLAGRTFALANYIPGDSIYVVADPEDGSSVFFQSLGMELDPDLVAAAGGTSGRAQLSLEQAGMLDADLLVLFSNDGTPRDLVGYENLPAVRSGAVAEVDYVPVVGLNTPSPLSIPYSLGVVRPALEAAS